ncbi:cytochrome P450 [Immersiella caudata]|uniref:Cytochrome P450 n=1 Tax=Immersiella caudata TaxID=314043 RepID=A0AA39WKJ4_9PEZI|nr:cytochrome P450 [Immersiella caudata]
MASLPPIIQSWVSNLQYYTSTIQSYISTHISTQEWTDYQPLIATVVAVLSALYVVLYRLQSVKRHPDEPPVIAAGVPYLGHLLGMAMFGGRYVKGIGLKHRDKPVFTLPVPFSRIYVVTDPTLANAVQRASKALSFMPLVPDITKRVLGFDAAHDAILRKDIDPEPGQPKGVLADLHELVWSYLGPGQTLTDLSLRASRELARQVNLYAEAHDRDPEVVSLLIWIRHFVAISTANFLYGARNPLALQPELEGSFWDFDHGLGALLMGIFPSITAGKAYRGREALATAFAEYLEDGRHNDEEVSPIIRQRIERLLQHGFTLREASRSEVSFLFAGIVNTATTTFWVVLHLFARPDLLNYIRAELLAGAVTELDMGGDKPTRLLDQEALKTNCPTLMSVFRESLRVGSDFYSTRLVKTDTLLSGRHFFAKDSVVQIAGGVIHADTGIWGPSADQFDPVRFIKLQQQSSSSSASSSSTNLTRESSSSSTLSSAKDENEKVKGVHPAAFRAFGGGKTLCPGRHFATHEILAFVAMIVLTVDLEAESGGEIVVPEKEDGVMPVHILEPKTDVRVKVRVRKDGGEVVVVR